MENTMTYDDAMKRVEALVQELEQAEALSMDIYQKKADEAKKLLDYCESLLKVNG